jgi:hypothetical protein
VSYAYDEDINIKIHKYQSVCYQYVALCVLSKKDESRMQAAEIRAWLKF